MYILSRKPQNLVPSRWYIVVQSTTSQFAQRCKKGEQHSPTRNTFALARGCDEIHNYWQYKKFAGVDAYIDPKAGKTKLLG